MATFSVATVDGKEITIELNVDMRSPALSELLRDLLKPGGWLMATEVIKAPGRDSKRADILLFGSGIVAIRQA